MERPNRQAILKNRYTDTHYVYADANGQPLIIENSLPKGGLTYTSPTGKAYVYVIFWTRIVNNTAAAVHLSVAVPADSFKLADKPATSVALPTSAPVQTDKRLSKPDNYFKIVFSLRGNERAESTFVQLGLLIAAGG